MPPTHKEGVTKKDGGAIPTTICNALLSQPLAQVLLVCADSLEAVDDPYTRLTA